MYEQASPDLHAVSALGLALKSRGICENISMPHEGELPGWIEDYAKQCMEILQESHKIL